MFPPKSNNPPRTRLSNAPTAIHKSLIIFILSVKNYNKASPASPKRQAHTAPTASTPHNSQYIRRCRSASRISHFQNRYRQFSCSFIVSLSPTKKIPLRGNTKTTRFSTGFAQPHPQQTAECGFCFSKIIISTVDR